MNNEKTVSELNDLLQIINDRLEGFQKVEKKVIDGHPGLEGQYDRMVTQSNQMRSDLVTLISKKGGHPDDSTTVAGGLHRTWIDLKNSLTGNNDEATLENVAFGEKAAVKAFEDALDSGNLCSESTNLVQDQLHQLQASYQKFSNLEDRTN